MPLKIVTRAGGFVAALLFCLPLVSCRAQMPAAQTPTTAQIEATPALQPLHYTTSWIGNTWGFAPGYNGGKHVQNDIQQMWVKSDGTVYAGAAWDEGHFAGGIYKNGDQLGTLQDTFQDFAGIGAVTGDATFIYAARGKFIRRYRPDGSHAGFPGGGPSPFDGGTDNIACVDRPEGEVAYLAADALRHRLYAEVRSADKGGGNPTREVQAFDISDGIKPLAKWPVLSLGPLVCAPDGSLWVALSSDPDGPKSTPTPR